MSKALFLDRDGVVNPDYGHVYKKEDFYFMPGVFELVKCANECGYLVFVVTNQGGIGRGLYSEGEFLELSEWMCGEFLKNGGEIKKVYYSPFHPIHGIGEYKRDSECRKPNPGMILSAVKEFNLDLTDSIMIGDKDSDMLAAKAAGVTHRVFFPNARFEQDSKAKTMQVSSLFEVLKLIEG